MSDRTEERLQFAKVIARSAGEMAKEYFSEISELVITSKGAQDHVSNADTDVETFLRAEITKSFPFDGIVGEEFGAVGTTSGYTWVIDPIDGTANFITGIPAWCVVLACVYEDETVLGVIFDPNNNEMFWASNTGISYLNEIRLQVAETEGLHDGNTGVGMNGRTATEDAVRMVDALVQRGGIFYRNASGALMLAYVASGRLIGYVESHMNAWDCLAGQLLIKQAGGKIEAQSARDMLQNGGRVVASSPQIFDELVEMSNQAFK